MSVQINREAAGRALFDQTFKGTLPLYPTWEEQPASFRQEMEIKGAKIALAALVYDEGMLAEQDA